MSRLSKTITLIVLISLLPQAHIFSQGFNDLSEAQLDERISFIDNHFRAEREKEKVWFWGWFAFMSTVLTSSAVLYFALPDDNPNKDVQPISMITATVALSNLILFRPMSLSANSTLSEMPANSKAEKVKKLERAEDLMRRAVFRQKYGKGWFSHLGTFAVATASSLVEWLQFDRPGFAAARFVASMVVGEYKIYTQSRGSIEAHKNYRARYYGEKSSYRKSHEIHLAFWGTGAAAVIRF